MKIETFNKRNKMSDVAENLGREIFQRQLMKGKILELEEEIKLLKKELKREREGNDYTAEFDSNALQAMQLALSIVNQRKIKSEDL